MHSDTKIPILYATLFDMYYHIHILQKRNYHEIKINLLEEELLSRIVEPYQQGEPIVLNGKTIQLNTIERIMIYETTISLDDIIKGFQKQYDNDSSQFKMFGASPQIKAMETGKNVSDKYIIGHAGFLKSRIEKKHIKSLDSIIDGAAKVRVFIVHGHDQALKDETCVFLREIGFDPIVLHRQVDGGLTIIEKFEKYADVSYAFILLTPDDYGFSAEELKKPELERKGGFRARQNVIFELGFFIGKLQRANVCCLFKDVEVPSDISGLIFKKINKSIQEVGYEIIKELKNAGLNPRLEY